MGTRHGHYCSNLWIGKTRYPKDIRGKMPLNKSQMGRKRTASKLRPQAGTTKTECVAEQHSRETPKMPGGISELQEFLQRPLH